MASRQIAPDIQAQLASEFTPERRDDAHDVLELLDAELGARKSENDRILRCVLFLARGNLEQLVDYADRASADYRDVIYWAEYDHDDRKVRDFDEPFRGPFSD